MKNQESNSNPHLPIRKTWIAKVSGSFDVLKGDEISTEDKINKLHGEVRSLRLCNLITSACFFIASIIFMVLYLRIYLYYRQTLEMNQQLLEVLQQLEPAYQVLQSAIEQLLEVLQ